MPDGTTFVDNPVVQKPIVIPEGKFEAPGDYRISTVLLNLAGRPRNVDLIKQTFAGNCAEYTVLNAVIIAKAAGLSVNPEIAEYLSLNPRLNLNSLEKDLIIPLLLTTQERHPEQPATVEDVNNLDTKFSNPYESLTKQNSVLLFRETLSPITSKIETTDKLSNSGDIKRATIDFLSAFFIGTSDHATCILKLGEQYLHVDPYFNQNVVKTVTSNEAFSILDRAIAQPGSIVTRNNLFT